MLLTQGNITNVSGLTFADNQIKMFEGTIECNVMSAAIFDITSITLKIFGNVLSDGFVTIRDGYIFGIRGLAGNVQSGSSNPSTTCFRAPPSRTAI